MMSCTSLSQASRAKNRLLGLIGVPRTDPELEKSLPREGSGTIIPLRTLPGAAQTARDGSNNPSPVLGCAYVNSRGTSDRLGGPDSRFNRTSHLSWHSDNA